VYKTLIKGRTVYGGGGITPDIYIPMDTSMLNPFVMGVYTNNLLPEFAYNYFADNKAIFTKYTSADDFKTNFIVGDKLYNDFVSYCFEHGVPKSTESYVEKSKKYLSYRLKAFLAKQGWKSDGFYEVAAQDDKMIQRALQELEK